MGQAEKRLHHASILFLFIFCKNASDPKRLWDMLRLCTTDVRWNGGNRASRFVSMS